VTVEQAKAATGWDLKIDAKLAVSQAPTAEELATLRELHARTAKAHGGTGALE
jgi:glutaconate CoA-transferase subunit B